MKKKIVILDRDGVIIYDNKYHLGHTKTWKRKVKILPGVVTGIKKLNKAGIPVYLITNQPGVAIKDFPLLTMKKAREVNQFVLDILDKRGAHIEEAFYCPHASPVYTKKRSNYKFNKKLVCNCTCIKPRLGMVFASLKNEGLNRKNTKVYVVGDRASDIKAAMNINGIGILIPFVNEPGQVEKIKKLKGKIYIAKTFLDGIKYIIK